MDGPDSTGRMTSAGDNLVHYGVKGMKWGVHRATSSSGTPKPPASEDVLKVDRYKETIKAGSTRALSNKELRDVVERMNLEQQYSKLIGSKKSTIDLGHDQAKKILGLGDTLSRAYALANSPAGKAARKLIVGV